MTAHDNAIIQRLQSIRKGEKVIYYVGPSNCDLSCPVFAYAYELSLEKKVRLFQRRIEPPMLNGKENPTSGVGKFEYLAVGV